ncbi:MAG: ADP-forming succinate--CoA ligase subunit beta [Gammaproteobacteria bacterium]|nr:MAG: ADP-forming succinate--CoA ligase subunit beta [Gammaproteobacteria bacterium]
MNLHEYQAKELLSSYNIKVPRGFLVEDNNFNPQVLDNLKVHKWVAKVQIHSGARGKAGGVLVSSDKNDIQQFIKNKIGTNLITHQTTKKGLLINSIWIEEASDIKQEIYLSFAINRQSQKINIVASSDGGMNIEDIAQKNPEKIININIEQNIGISPYHIRKVGFFLKLDSKPFEQLSSFLTNLYHLFVEKDLSQLEINPLIINKDDDLVCLDAKINIDDNALCRQEELLTKRDLSQEDAREIEADKWELNYISLDGDIGCMVNGAGLAMATMDLIKLHGGEPANFLDVGGSTTSERVAKAFEIILSDKNVKVILVNIFGGIVRCDLIAEGIIEAARNTTNLVPLIVRLEGNMAEIGIELLKKSDIDIMIPENLTDAAIKSVQVAKK